MSMADLRRPGAAAAAIAALAATVATASPAVATVPAATTARTAGRSLQTLFRDVRVFSKPGVSATVLTRLGSAGTGISIACWTTGTDYKDSPIWYRITAPLAGYVSAFDVTAHFAPAIGVPHCRSPRLRETFNSLAVNLRIRTSPSVTATISGYLVSVGSPVVIDCYTTGTLIYGDPIWYHAVSPVAGYVTGRFLNTGGDPVPGVPRC